MNHYANRKFWAAYDKLPDEIRRLADRNFTLLRANPHHPSLHFRRIGRYWSARVGQDYRAVAVMAGDDFVWFWIGPHDEYNKFLG